MEHIAEIANDLKLDHKADIVHIDVKSETLAIVTLEFKNDWAKQFQVTPKGVKEIW